jgi:hypothetical protein
MATIRVSSLPEIKVDRITDDDYYIVNDGDITTSKVSFKQMVLGIAERDIEFTGDVTFTGDVVMDGGVDGDFYNKNETYSKVEVDAFVNALENYDEMQDDKLLPLIKLSGELEGTEFYRDFPGTIISSQATTRSALTELEAFSIDNRTLIESSDTSISDLSDELAALDVRVTDLELIINGDATTDGLVFELTQLTNRVTVNEGDIVVLQGKVSVNETNIAQLQTDLLDLTTDSIDHDEKLDSLIALSGLPEKTDDLGTFTGTVITDSTTVKSALQELETEVDLKAPIDNPTFTTKITAPKAKNSVPCYYDNVSQLPTGSTYVQGVFAFANSSGSGYVSTGTGWERIISYDESSGATPDRTAMFKMLGYDAAYSSESDAAANGIGIGETYVYSAANSLADGIIRANFATAP